MREWWVKWKPWVFFLVVTAVWVAGIVLPLFPQLVSGVPPEENPYVGVSSAVIGAGPFLLYILYQEYVKSPRFVITTTEDEDGVSGVYFDKLIVEQGNSAFPIIEVVTTVKNVGRESVEDASVRVNLVPNDPTMREISFDSRWTGDLYASSTDLHPGRERELLLFQIIPTQECIDQLDIRTGDTDVRLDKTDIFSLDFDPSDGDDLVEDLPGELYLQRPLNSDSESFEYEAQAVSTEAKRRFIGRTIPCAESFDVSIRIHSSDWSGPIAVGTVSLSPHVLQGDWYSTEEKYRDIREGLEKIDWTKPFE